MNQAPPGNSIHAQVSLAPRTTFEVGGNAAWWVEARSEAAVSEAVRWAANERIAIAVLGGGSNIVASDAGFDGLVLQVAIRGIERLPAAGGRVRVRVGAGEQLDRWIEHCTECGWSGLECLSGIPGSVGATPIQNVGAYGQEAGDAIVHVHAIDRQTLCEVRIDRDTCRFGYRDSAFKRDLRDRYVVTSVVFELVPDAPPSVRYQELMRRLEQLGIHTPTLAEVRREVLELRRSKSMLLDADDPNRRSAGSFFVNPVVSRDVADSVERRAASLAPVSRMPRFHNESGIKLSAAWLLECAGYRKGMASGNVGLSTRHALAVVNRGGGTAAEILEFASTIRGGVHERFGLWLEPEPVLLGFTPEQLRHWFPGASA